MEETNMVDKVIHLGGNQHGRGYAHGCDNHYGGG